MKKRYTIKDVGKGCVAIKNDGTMEQIKEALRLAFPNDIYGFMMSETYEEQAFFWKCANTNMWTFGNETNLPTQSVKEFLEWQPERGEMVLVRSADNHKWEPRMFLVEITGAREPFITMLHGHEDRLNKELVFDTILWRQIKQIEKPEEIKHELIEVKVTLNGESINPMQFTQEQWNKIIANQ